MLVTLKPWKLQQNFNMFMELTLLLGSGSILESLRLRKRLVVVVNNTLADNHQAELAEELEKNSYLLLCTPR
ncbi:N-acetylglucosaminyldiphosphodolichol N-acetylglucosaminyltransferase catalytic subunit alg13 [Entomophthora muscae]|uniref:N-acetylglucosaminyldiphosphodolichol N-acetylglucosaminyltransferase catalytic subunit alg13 n=1 Tax=Entomophthora muscae TaxID=34485 RepID=A0ACC2UG32_9FUNG|nr:N-acetylglucosaminyldiphosphodolichol N-acetylglucosaminyltransferase catalytic subunit alg13 [Entomophthora muscae]